TSWSRSARSTARPRPPPRAASCAARSTGCSDRRLAGRARKLMLARLSIRDVVLVDQLDLALEAGFAALTGARGDAKLVRHGSQQAVVTAAFELDDDHPVRALLRDRGLDSEGPIIIRRA